MTYWLRHAKRCAQSHLSPHPYQLQAVTEEGDKRREKSLQLIRREPERPEALTQGLWSRSGAEAELMPGVEA